MCDTCKRGPDLRIHDHGSVFLLEPASDAGQEWIDEHIGEAQTWGNSIVVEHRYIGGIAAGAMADGLEVE
jgi:hypothetical protein